MKNIFTIIQLIGAICIALISVIPIIAYFSIPVFIVVLLYKLIVLI